LSSHLLSSSLLASPLPPTYSLTREHTLSLSRSLSLALSRSAGHRNEAHLNATDIALANDCTEAVRFLHSRGGRASMLLGEPVLVTRPSWFPAHLPPSSQPLPLSSSTSSSTSTSTAYLSSSSSATLEFDALTPTRVPSDSEVEASAALAAVDGVSLAARFEVELHLLDDDTDAIPLSSLSLLQMRDVVDRLHSALRRAHDLERRKHDLLTHTHPLAVGQTASESGRTDAERSCDQGGASGGGGGGGGATATLARLASAAECCVCFRDMINTW
jgi:hypothetical protein